MICAKRSTPVYNGSVDPYMHPQIPIGTLSVAAYRRALQGRRSIVSAFLPIACVVCSGAGYGLGVWNGMHTDRLDMDAALHVLNDTHMPQNRRENALGQLYVLAATATKAIVESRQQTALQATASAYLHNLRLTIDQKPH
jgi:hypothetical protein